MGGDRANFRGWQAGEEEGTHLKKKGRRNFFSLSLSLSLALPFRCDPICTLFILLLLLLHQEGWKDEMQQEDDAVGRTRGSW